MFAWYVSVALAGGGLIPTEWVRPPIVVLCPGAPVTWQQVRDQLDAWEAHGAPYLPLVQPKRCDNPRQRDRAFIVGKRSAWAPWEPNVLGYTYHSPDANEGFALEDWARIELRSDDLGVLRHELGHLWFGHVEGPHVMSPYKSEADPDGWEGVPEAFAKLRRPAQAPVALGRVARQESAWYDQPD